MKPSVTGFFDFLDNIDRRVIYLFVAISLAVPLINNISLPPAEMTTSTAFYETIEGIEKKPGTLVLISADWGPNTKAENEPQTKVALCALWNYFDVFALIALS